jgi:NAD(P)-dependent dehydrogenase (short-subunit alcohol dehydrogenase family)
MAVQSSRQENREGTPNMHFEAKKVIVVGGSAGIGRQAAVDVVDHGRSAVIVGRSKARVDDTVAELTPRTRRRNDNPPAANAEPHREGTRK